MNFRDTWFILEQIIPYKKYNGYFISWCRWAQKVKLRELPAEPIYAAMFMLQRIQEEASLPTVEATAYSVKYFYIFLWISKIHVIRQLLKNLLEAAKSLLNSWKNKKEPITVEQIKIIYEKTVQHRKQNKNLLNVRNFLMIILGFSGFLTFSELASLRRCDIVFYQTCM